MNTEKETITIEWLHKVNACSDSIIWFKKQKTHDTFEILNLLIEENKLDLCSLWIYELLNEECFKYALYLYICAITPVNKRRKRLLKAIKYGIELLKREVKNERITSKCNGKRANSKNR